MVTESQRSSKFQDYKLGGDTVRLIWAYSDDDPANENLVSYHGTRRGTRSVFLFGHATQRFDDLNDAETMIWDMKANSFKIPEDKHTHYNCHLIKGPDVADVKHHIIGVRH